MERPNIELFLRGIDSTGVPRAGAKWVAGYALELETENTTLRTELKAARSSLDAARRIRRSDNEAFREILSELDALKKR